LDVRRSLQLANSPFRPDRYRPIPEHPLRGKSVMDPGQFKTLSERIAIGRTEFLDRVKKMVSATSPEQSIEARRSARHEHGMRMAGRSGASFSLHAPFLRCAGPPSSSRSRKRIGTTP